MTYLLGDLASETERLRLQSLVWEPAGRRLLRLLGDGAGSRVLDVGCGAMGWLRLLSDWVGPSGSCTGTDVAAGLLARAQDLVAAEGLRNVTLVDDDLFDSRLPEGAFDLVHARFQLAPLGCAAEQLRAYRRLLRPGGVLVLEDPDSSSWTYSPEAPRTAELIGVVRDAFRAAGGDFDAGHAAVHLLAGDGLYPTSRVEHVVLAEAHPYLRLPLQFAASLRPRLEQPVPTADLDRLLADSAAEIERPGTRGVTFTLVQTWATVP
jgi:SAM-dependent methyltransferase